MTLFRVALTLVATVLFGLTVPAYRLVWQRGWEAHDMLLVFSSACFVVAMVVPWVLR
jgi:hypothetical protein